MFLKALLSSILVTHNREVARAIVGDVAGQRGRIAIGRTSGSLRCRDQTHCRDEQSHFSVQCEWSKWWTFGLKFFTKMSMIIPIMFRKWWQLCSVLLTDIISPTDMEAFISAWMLTFSSELTFSIFCGYLLINSLAMRLESGQKFRV